MANFNIFKQPWNKDKMDNWRQPITHIGGNCGELAISYLGLTSNEVCVRDSLENFRRGNYGRLTTEIDHFLTEHKKYYSIEFGDSYTLTPEDFLDNNSELATLIGKGNETLILLESQVSSVGHYLVLAMIDAALTHGTVASALGMHT